MPTYYLYFKPIIVAIQRFGPDDGIKTIHLAEVLGHSIAAEDTVPVGQLNDLRIEGDHLVASGRLIVRDRE